jgi:hypothetical protein
MTPRKRPEDRAKMGRPTVVTPEVLAKLEQAFGMGCSDKEACLYADISMDALYNHQNRNPHFTEWKALLKEKPVLKARSVVVNSLSDPETSKWYLERKTKGEFNSRQALELTGKDGGPITIAELVAKNAD